MAAWSTGSARRDPFAAVDEAMRAARPSLQGAMTVASGAVHPSALVPAAALGSQLAGARAHGPAVGLRSEVER